ncbi:MAG TPA: NADH-quinone oxidoreductase subunit C, partial [Pirellulaceae bacterium]|nr:NADH-quinone oxidoreductase subunit C [Pirellulaceae bacterium]
MTTTIDSLRTANGQPVAVAEVPVVPYEVFAETLSTLTASPSVELSALFGMPGGSQSLRVIAATSNASTGAIDLFAMDVGDRYPSLTRQVAKAHWFERELAEQWGVVPEDHPWLKPIRFHRSYREGHDAWNRSVGDQILPSVQPLGTDYFKVQGNQIHEVAVGPVHAGVIEPGHFRFQCHGEVVFTLEIEL